MSLPLPLSLAIERGFEVVLRLDPDVRTRLQELDGKVIEVQLTQPSISLVLAIVGGRIQVLGELDDPADTTIRGSLSALQSLRQGNDAVYRGDVTIEGDVGTGQVLNDILGSIDPDWEELVSPFMGDALAHRMGVVAKQFGQWSERTRSTLRTNTSDYLQEEAEVLAPNAAIKEFCAEVDDMRAATDRLAARVRRLERTAGDNP